MFNLGRGVLPEAREFKKGVKLMRYDIVKGGVESGLLARYACVKK